MKRTTIIADERLIFDAKRLARRTGVTFTAVVQDALREYVAAHEQPRTFSIMGIASSNRVLDHDNLDRELMAGLHRYEGFSPDAPDPGLYPELRTVEDGTASGDRACP